MIPGHWRVSNDNIFNLLSAETHRINFQDIGERLINQQSVFVDTQDNIPGSPRVSYDIIITQTQLR